MSRNLLHRHCHSPAASKNHSVAGTTAGEAVRMDSKAGKMPVRLVQKTNVHNPLETLFHCPIVVPRGIRARRVKK